MRRRQIPPKGDEKSHSNGLKKEDLFIEGQAPGLVHCVSMKGLAFRVVFSWATGMVF